MIDLMGLSITRCGNYLTISLGGFLIYEFCGLTPSLKIATRTRAKLQLPLLIKITNWLKELFISLYRGF